MPSSYYQLLLLSHSQYMAIFIIKNIVSFCMLYVYKSINQLNNIHSFFCPQIDLSVYISMHPQHILLRNNDEILLLPRLILVFSLGSLSISPLLLLNSGKLIKFSFLPL